MKERGNWLNLPGKHNSVLWNLGPRKSLTISPHITIRLIRGWRFRIEGTYSFHFYREPLPTFEDVKGILKVNQTDKPCLTCEGSGYVLCQVELDGSKTYGGCPDCKEE